MSHATHDENVISANLERLRSLAQKNISEERYKDLRLIIGSLVDRQEYAKYHYGEYRRIVDKKNNVHKQVALILSNNEEDYWDKVGIKSNIVVCMQHLHIVHDILAHLIAYTLDLKYDNERKITLRNVCQRIQTNTDFVDLSNLLVDLVDNDNFDYLVANVNHSKHKYNIEPSITVAPQEASPIKCVFSQFSHHKITYPKKNADEFIQEEFNRELRIIIQIENELIQILETTILQEA